MASARSCGSKLPVISFKTPRLAEVFEAYFVRQSTALFASGSAWDMLKIQFAWSPAYIFWIGTSRSFGGGVLSFIISMTSPQSVSIWTLSKPSLEAKHMPSWMDQTSASRALFFPKLQTSSESSLHRKPIGLTYAKSHPAQSTIKLILWTLIIIIFNYLNKLIGDVKWMDPFTKFA